MTDKNVVNISFPQIETITENNESYHLKHLRNERIKCTEECAKNVLKVS